MTDEELARRVSAIQAEARQLVPEWEPWMTEQVGYGGAGNDDGDFRKTRRREKDRRRYLRRMADPEAYAAYLAKARADQAVRDAAKRAERDLTETPDAGR